MKKSSILIVAITCMISLFSMNASAQKVGVVDGQKVLDSYSEYAAATTKMNGIIKLWQDTLGMMNKAAQDKFDSYQKIKESMSKDALAKADEELRKMQTEIQNYNLSKSDQQNGEIVKVRKDIMAPIVEKVKNAINTVAKKKKLDIILDKGNVAFVGEEVKDITSEVSDSLKK